jgi:hypothetical protein
MAQGMKLERASQIDGWIIWSELEWLAQQASRHTNILEVGCWLGRSTRALADNTSGVVTVVDTFLGSPEHREFLEDKPKDWLWENFTANTRELLNLRAIPMSSTEASRYFTTLESETRFDMIFLDAAHDYESVKQDILAWMPLLAPGGLFSGHDYGPNWPEVAKAVDELIPNVQIGANQIWFKP